MATLESAMEEERLAIMELIEGQSSSQTTRRESKPGAPAYKVKSLFDDDDDTPAVPVPAGRGARKKSTDNPGFENGRAIPRSPPPSSPRTGLFGKKKTPSYDDYDFTTSAPSTDLRRVSNSASTRPVQPIIPSTISSTLDGVPAKNSKGRRISAPAKGRSISPAINKGRLRSSSPGAGLLSVSPAGRSLIADSGQVVDLDHAYRRLSDDALARSGSSVLSALPKRDLGDMAPGAGESYTDKGGGGVRLNKDYDPELAVVDDSSEEGTDSTDDSDFEEGVHNGIIGGKKKRTRSNSAGTEDSQGSDGRNRRQSSSLLGAADDERKMILQSKSRKVKSLIPDISVSGPPSPGQLSTRRSSVHPNTNYNRDISSGGATPNTSEEDVARMESEKAARLSMIVSEIKSPSDDRVVRMITRGDFGAMLQEAETGKRKTRTYLVATDLSAEAAYALEWTIGTVLRDGDTMIAVYAFDEDSSSLLPTPNLSQLTLAADANASSVAIPKPVLHHSASAPSSTPAHPSPLSQSSLIESGFSSVTTTSPATATQSTTSPGFNSPQSGPMNAEMQKKSDRYRAAEGITALISRLLKKTKLQVNVIIEVIHCKTPKHLMLEVIDFFQPTLVILGSRGRSAIKGVLLGSFSNYLVTKSSVPVMVARKKLKHSKKSKPLNVRQVNNLSNAVAPGHSALESAIVD